jgi:hypothetical protein
MDGFAAYSIGPAAWRDVGGDAPGLVAGKQVRCRTPAGLLLEIDVGQRLAVGVAHDEAGLRSP